MTDAWVQDVLYFWFQELKPVQWFTKSDAADQMIISRFGRLHNCKSTQDASVFSVEPQTALAAIILFDQFSRNIFRGTPESFTSDRIALTLARHIVDYGRDKPIKTAENVFAYMPFEYSENMADQAFALMQVLGNKKRVKPCECAPRPYR